jgi:hypothetical protein
MKRLRQATVLFVLLFSILFACKKDDPSTPDPVVTPPPPPPPPPAAPPTGGPTPPPSAPPLAGSAPYSGTWSGTATVRDSFPDFCYFTDKSLEIILNCTVLADSVHVEETIKDDTRTFTYYWRGTIKKDTLEMVSRRNVNCFGETKLREMVIKAPITALTDKYRVQASSVYSMCPPNCIFIFTYDLSKPK